MRHAWTVSSGYLKKARHAAATAMTTHKRMVRGVLSTHSRTVRAISPSQERTSGSGRRSRAGAGASSGSGGVEGVVPIELLFGFFHQKWTFRRNTAKGP
ncbi:hypothetical protein ACFOYY_41345, partial [Streptosporangium jomthongense]